MMAATISVAIRSTMNTASKTLMNTKLRPLSLCALAVFLCSCAATSVKESWKAPDSHPPSGKIAVLTVDERRDLRIGFENRFVTYLERAGTPALTTFNLLSLSEIKQDKQAAAQRLLASGTEALLIMRLVNVGSSYRETRPGGERYASTINGFETTGWYDYLSMGYMDMSATYGNEKLSVLLETSLYDLKTEKRMWSGMSETVLKGNMDRVAEMDPLVEKIIAAMRKDGVIR
jgi:hypothetical protein